MKQIALTLLSGIIFLTACEQVTHQQIIVSETPSPASTTHPTSTPLITFTPTEALETVSCLPKATQSAPIDGSHIGLRTPPELDGIKNLDSLLIQSGDDFSIGLNLIQKGQSQYSFWLEKFCDNPNGQRFTEVIDEIILRPLNEGEFAVTTCELDNKMSSHVIAIGYYHEEIISGKTYKKVIAIQAWIINFNNWTFIEISKEQLKNVSCIHETS